MKRWLVALFLIAFSLPALAQSNVIGSGVFGDAKSSGPPPSYTPQGINFDSTAWAARATALSITNSGSGLCSFWMKNPNATATQHTILSIGNAFGAAGSFSIAVSGSSGKVFASGKNSSNTTVLSMQTTVAYVSMSSWANFIISYNLATPRAQIYVNGSPDVSVITDTLGGTIVYSGTDNQLGSGHAGTVTLNANIADLQCWFGVDYDLTVAANVAAFYSGGNAVDPTIGPSGIGLGTAPILFYGDASLWPQNGTPANRGGGGAFTWQSATIANAASNPP